MILLRGADMTGCTPILDINRTEKVKGASAGGGGEGTILGIRKYRSVFPEPQRASELAPGLGKRFYQF